MQLQRELNAQDPRYAVPCNSNVAHRQHRVRPAPHINMRGAARRGYYDVSYSVGPSIVVSPVLQNIVAFKKIDVFF